MDVHTYFKGLSSGIPEGVQRKMDVHAYSGETTQELQRNMSVSSASVARPHRDLRSPNGHSAFGFPHRDRRSLRSRDATSRLEATKSLLDPNESTTNPPFIEDDGGSRSNPGLPLVREPTVPVQERPSWSTNADREYNKVSQQNTNNNKKTSHKSKFIKYSFRKIKDKMHISPLFYSNKIFIADTKNYGSSLHSSFEIDRSGEEVITPRRNSKEMYGYRPRSISI